MARMAVRANFDAGVSDYAGLSECLDRLAAQKRENRPLALYRLQFHQRFKFADARRLVPYLCALGITHCYASPILKARTGSTHGYDITDHNQLNPEIGTEEEFHALVRELQAHGMGLVLDIVPNHMGVGYGDNPWWQDVLENGRTSEYAGFFDIDWEPVKTELRNKVLIPILGDVYGEELERGRIRLNHEHGRFFLTYYDRELPVDPQTIPMVFETLGDLRNQPPEITPSDADRAVLETVVFNLRQLPGHSTEDADLAPRRRRDAADLKRRLRELVEASPQVLALVNEAARCSNGEPGAPHSFDALHRLLEAQPYRLAYWRVSAEEINYRRFFDINDLVGLRMENPLVFAATHGLVRKLLADGSISGLRMDHPDGLLNPVQYFTRVQMLYAASQCSGSEPQPPLADNGIELPIQELFSQHNWMNQQTPLYVVAEKILEPGEHLPDDWPVDGTVGYDFARVANGVFIDARHEREFTHAYRRFVGGPVDVETLIYESKKRIMLSALSSEVTVLSHILEEISSRDRRARDITRPLLTKAICETIACLPVYRTYIDERGQVSDRDRGYIEQAIARAKRRNPGTTVLLFDWLRDTLLLKNHDFAGPEWSRKRLRFVLKFQQLSGPVMAKGLEDTVCYVYNRFVSVNEVGCTPAEFGVTVDEFHRANLERLERWPFSMLAGSTHDSKRSEDVRARINVLSEIPRQWALQSMRWRRLNRGRKQVLGDGRMVPDYNEEYLLYQTVAGAYPLHDAGPERGRFIHRLQQYMNKAVHEAKVNLSWVNQNPEYTAALETFIKRIFQPGTASRPNFFLQELDKFLLPVAFFGAINSLAQTLLRLTAPGVPDIYQGTELWDFSLVDPDNRRPVDFEHRQRQLTELLRDPRSAMNGAESALLSLGDELLSSWRDGRVKMWLIVRTLNFRRGRAALFQSGSYLPLHGAEEKQDHLLAFARESMGEAAVVAVPRFACTLMNGQVSPPLGEAWGAAELVLPPGYKDFVNVLTGERLSSSNGRTLSCREVFAHFPVALLSSR